MNRWLKFVLWGLVAFVLNMTGPGVSSSKAGIVGKQVEYTAEGGSMQGYLAYDEGIQGRQYEEGSKGIIWQLQVFSLR